MEISRFTLKRIFRELRRQRAEIGNLKSELDQVREMPAEILEEIQRIWESDPEANENNG